jgi:hypothetical protein
MISITSWWVRIWIRKNFCFCNQVLKHVRKSRHNEKRDCDCPMPITSSPKSVRGFSFRIPFDLSRWLNVCISISILWNRYSSYHLQTWISLLFNSKNLLYDSHSKKLEFAEDGNSKFNYIGWHCGWKVDNVTYRECARLSRHDNFEGCRNCILNLDWWHLRFGKFKSDIKLSGFESCN